MKLVDLCPECGEPTDAVTNLTGPAKLPSPGDLAVCFYCGAFATFDDRRRRRRPTPAELASYRQDRAAMAAQRAVRARRGNP